MNIINHNINGDSEKNHNNDRKSAEDYIFWEINPKTGSVKILPSKVYELLALYGVAKYYPDKQSQNVKPVIVLIRDNIIEPVGKDFMLSFCKNFIELINIPSNEKNAVLDALHRSTQIFSETNQYLLVQKEVKTVQDTADSSYFFYRNSAVRVTADNIEIVPYDKLDGCVWKSNIKPFDIYLENAQIVTKNAVFLRFLSDITRKGTNNEINKKRLAHLFSLIGYMLHRYKSYSNAKAVVIMDENPSFSPEGGTGKSMIFKAIGNVREVVPEDGRNFDPGNRFAFQHVNESVDIFVIDDAAANLKFAKLFPYITEAFPVEVKFITRRTIPFQDAPKIAITTNYSIDGIGGSYNRRKYEFEISAYYNEKLSPETKYKQTFFQSWNEEEWNLFHNLMFIATKFYLKNGVVESEPLNLKKTHLINATSEEFVEFSDENITVNQEYNKKDLLDLFKTQYPVNAFVSVRLFTKWLKSYARINEYEMIERHSDADYFVKFIIADEQTIQPALAN